MYYLHDCLGPTSLKDGQGLRLESEDISEDKIAIKEDTETEVKKRMMREPRNDTNTIRYERGSRGETLSLSW